MKKGVLDVLRQGRDYFYAQKYRFDQGIQFLVFVNFALLVITASDKLKPYIGIESTPVLIVAMIFSGFLGVFVFGYFLDRFIRQQQRQEIEAEKRSYLWQKNFAQQAGIMREIDELKKQLKRKK